MKNTFIKILCLSLALMMLLSACNAGGAGDQTTSPATEAPSETESETQGGGDNIIGDLFAPVSAKQILFDDSMNIENYLTGLTSNHKASIVEVDGKWVLKIVCSKRTAATIEFDYAKYMSDYNIEHIDGTKVQNVLAMVRKGEDGKFERNLALASDALTLTEDGKLAKATLGFLGNMRKNEVIYISSIAFATNSDDILRFSDLSVYALGYSDKIKIENYDPVVHEQLTAPAEDESVKLWFDHATERVTRYTVAPTDKVGYTIQMAKNELEACQFFLHSPTNRKITIKLSDFTNNSGDTLRTNLGVEFYIEDGYLPEKGISKDLVYPDAVIPYESYVRDGFGSDEGGSYEYGTWVPIGPYSYKPWETETYPYRDTVRGFMIEAKTTANSKPGLYGATLEIYDAETGECIKMAKVYTYVYDVTISEEPTIDSLIGIWGEYYLGTYNAFGGYNDAQVMKAMANFMLEYRITPVFGTWWYQNVFTSEWCYNPRVTTIRASKALYDEWKDDPILMDKMVYYGQDEPGVPRGFDREITLEDGTTATYPDPYGILTIMSIAEEAKMLKNLWGWEDYRLLIPFERNARLDDLTSYPNIEQTAPLNLTWSFVESKLDGNEGALALFNKYKQEMIDAGDMFNFMSKYVNIWVPILYGYTPRGLSDVYTGCIYLQTVEQDKLYGEFSERLNELVEEEGHERWAYVACNPKYSSPYQNLLLFCDGTEPETMMWTCYQQDVTGFLYWREGYYNAKNRNTYAMRVPFSPTGPGDGILFYPGAIYGQIDPIPSLRFIGLRDGMEDYELLKMVEAAKGKDFARELASFVATSAVTYTEDDQLLRNVRSYMLRLLEETGK